MAFWKMAGLEVTPTIPSSIIPSSPPFFMSSRESSSTQGACPNSCILRKRSFTSTSLWGPSRGPVAQPLSSVYTRPAWRYGEPRTTLSPRTSRSRRRRRPVRGDLPLWVVDQTHDRTRAPKREQGLYERPGSEKRRSFPRRVYLRSLLRLYPPRRGCCSGFALRARGPLRRQERRCPPSHRAARGTGRC